ncbi:hypothetical protein QQL37_12495 [Pantoea agglomerans]|uniref:hypothetical protein n=1 Tax=Enterobacter agglomerans TaxID=549 RepID=UPI00202D43FC|nr:hypothetical protein [Pantoea agglomerans]MCL6409932.1 hypothetical protein [Pantoea agglomerans]
MNQDYLPLNPDNNETKLPTLMFAFEADGKVQRVIAEPTVYAQSSFPRGAVYVESSFHKEAVASQHDEIPKQEENMTAKGLIGKIEFRVTMGLALLTVVGVAVTAAWSISNSISDKNTALRQELSQTILTSKQELSLRVDRVEDKIDDGFKETSNQLTDLKVLLATQKNDKTEK